MKGLRRLQGGLFQKTWFDQARMAQFGKLVGADFVVTGRYVLWGQGTLKISVRAINVADGEIVAADKVKILTRGDTIEDPSSDGAP